MVDTRDLKSLGQQCLCGFESRPRHKTICNINISFMKISTKLSILLAAAFILSIPVSASAQDKTIKRKVAIGRFSNETQYANGLSYDKENDPMRKQALDILSSKLAASEKFILLERDDLDVLVAEAGEGMNKIGAR